MESKICTKCKTKKPLNNYPKDSSKKNGLSGQCKECNSRRRRDWYREQSPLDRQIRVMAMSIMGRTSGRRGKGYYYDKGIENRLGKTLPEVTNYLRENFSEDIQAMLDKGEKVSIDRIDSAGHYEHGNVRIMEFKENSLRGAINGGKTTQKLFGHVLLIEDLKTKKIIKVPSKAAAAKIIGCNKIMVIDHLNYSNPNPIFGRYKITREND